MEEFAISLHEFAYQYERIDSRNAVGYQVGYQLALAVGGLTVCQTVPQLVSLLSFCLDGSAQLFLALLQFFERPKGGGCCGHGLSV